jgi:flagellar hook-associated protein 1 FlgK
MAGILSTGVRALQANQTALQTTGNNIANANTVGYSRQKTVFSTVEGQFTGGGYIGNGVSVQTIQRNYSEFLTRQSTLATAASSADVTRYDKLKQLEGVFEGGTNGLGASISDMLNSFSDVVNAPNDLTARTVVLTRIDETASRIRATSQRLDDLQQGVTQELQQKINAVNSLTKNIAGLNEQITRAAGAGQPPNDLLDSRDQLIRDLNQYIQTTSIPADDGSVGLFIGGSQAIVLGNESTPVSLVSDRYSDPTKSKLAITRSGITFTMDEKTLGGGQISGLLRYQNVDQAEALNLLGRLTLSVTSAMNEQHKLGVDLNGTVGANLFTPTTFGKKNILEPTPPSTVNTGAMTGAQGPTLSVRDVTKLVASDYEMLVDAGGASFTIVRLSDGKVFAPADTAPLPTSGPDVIAQVDGLEIHNGFFAAANGGDRYLIKPYATSASDIRSQFSAPSALAVASPVSGTMGVTNQGTLQLAALTARSNPTAATPVVLTFTGTNTYTRSDDVSATVFTYTPGQAIEGTIPDLPPSSPLTYSNALSEWSVTLQGVPKLGDTVTLQPNAYPGLNSGNASAMMALRDVAMFDGGVLTDGYAGLISQIGIRTQSASYSAEVSQSIAANLEKDRAGVSGVNMDEEAAKLLQYQQGYQASAKVIQIAQNIFDTLIQGMGR